MGKGNSTAEGIVFLVVLLVVIIIMPKGTNPKTIVQPVSSTNITSNIKEASVTSNSTYSNKISLGTGNAPYVYQPYEEYITIDNISSEPINITNWKLKNGKDKRAYDNGGTLKFFPADIVTIGQAASFISPNGINTFQNIILNSGETAYVTTGSVSSQLTHKIVSFKENKCAGYLDSRKEYTFTPPLTRDCPRPRDEPGINLLDSECRRFVERMSSCHTPEFNTRDSNDEICYNCVDREPLPSSCVAFIKNRFNYDSCIAIHKNDPGFSGRSWRIFLGRSWEMWATEYETIELFDQSGRLVGSSKY